MTAPTIQGIAQARNPVAIGTVLLLLANAMPAQIPAGFYVVSSFHAVGVNGLPAGCGPFSGVGGLWLMHPRTAGLVIPVTGLPGDLIAGPPLSVWPAGANSVLILGDGRLAVGEVAWNASVDLHLITLNPGGMSVAAANKVILGEASVYGGAVRHAALLPNGKILVAVVGIVSGVLGSQDTSRLGIVNPLNLTVTPFEVVGLPGGEFNALVVDGDSWTAYVGIHDLVSATNWIYRVPLDAGKPAVATYVQSISASNGNAVTGFCLDNLGNLVVICRGATNNFFRIHMGGATPLVTPLISPSPNLSGVALEAETGGAAVVAALATGENVVYDANGSLLGQGPLLGGCASGLAIAPSVETYGAEVAAFDASLTWQFTPNPGGLPLRGNTAFSVTIVNGGVPRLGVWCVSSVPQDMHVTGPTGEFWLNVELSKVLLWGWLAGLPQESMPLPIPDCASLEGLSVFLQCLHLDPTAGVCASNGLSVTII